jgi:pSer/pThr/pTyr-binding forkhead associated (FHA) protein
MVELTLTFERKPIKSYQLDKPIILIGRDPTCDIQIDNVGISRHHARIEKKNDIFMLSDLASGNGTFVNGKRITSYNLNNGDEIGLWNYSVVFKAFEQVSDSAPSAAPEKPAAPKIDLDMTIAIDRNQLEMKQKERGSMIRGYLAFEEKGHGNRFFSLLKSTTFWGKDSFCDFKLSGFFIMPKHAMIVRDESGFRFINFASHSQGLINNMVKPDYRLKDGDTIKIGNILYKFFNGLPPVK